MIILDALKGQDAIAQGAALCDWVSGPRIRRKIDALKGQDTTAQGAALGEGTAIEVKP
jgi:hypothetical protein